MPNTPDIQQWHFRPRSPFILVWIAIPFALGAWLVWFAVSQAGSLGWLFFLLSALCSSIGALGFESWRRSWHNTRNGQEFIRLDEDDLSYCIEGVGAGSLPYTWLRSVYPVHTRGCQGVVIEYRRPETDRVPDRLILKDLYRLDLRGAGFRYVNPHDLIADAIKARCREGAYPALPSATSSASPMA